MTDDESGNGKQKISDMRYIDIHLLFNSGTPETGPRGLGGWLWVLQLRWLIGIGFGAMEFNRYPLYSAAVIVFAVLCFVFFYLRDHRFLTFHILFFVTGLIIVNSQNDSFLTSVLTLLPEIALLICITSSKRVKNTFVRKNKSR